jgi:hypothetical protein
MYGHSLLFTLMFACFAASACLLAIAFFRKLRAHLKKKRAWGTVRAAEKPQAGRFSVEVSQRLLIPAGSHHLHHPQPSPPGTLCIPPLGFDLLKEFEATSIATSSSSTSFAVIKSIASIAMRRSSKSSALDGIRKLPHYGVPARSFDPYRVAVSSYEGPQGSGL